MLSLSPLSFLKNDFDYDEYTIGLTSDHIKNNTLLVDLLQNKNLDKNVAAIYWRMNNVGMMDNDMMTHDNLPERLSSYFNMVVPLQSLSQSFDDKNIFMVSFALSPESKDDTYYTRANEFMLKYRHFNNEPVLLNNSSIDVIIQYSSNNKN